MGWLDRLRDVEPMSLGCLIWVLVVGLVSTAGLLHLPVTGAGVEVDPDPDGFALAEAAVKLLLGVALVGGFHVARRRRVPWAVAHWQRCPIVTRGFTCVILAWVLRRVSELVAPLSTPVAGYLLLLLAILLILSPVLILWGLLHREADWLRK